MSINVGDKIPEFKLINTNKDFLEDKDFLGKLCLSLFHFLLVVFVTRRFVS